MITPNDQNQVALLSVGAFAGTLVRLILKPEKTWQAWLGQFVIGILSGIFLGGYLASLLAANIWLTCCIAFIVGTSAEKAIELAQQKFGNGKGSDNDNDKNSQPPSKP